jgi:protein AFG1
MTLLFPQRPADTLLACYESRTKLFASSEVPIFQVFSDDPNAKSSHASDHVRSVMDDLGLSDQQIGHTSIFSGEEEIFAFARACSRLVQMGTKEWASHAGRIMGEESGL